MITFDGRGNGRSDRPREPEAYTADEFAADTLAVMDATGTARAALVSLSRGAEMALLLGADHQDRVEAIVFIAPAVPLPPAAPRAGAESAFTQPRDSYEGWGKWNRTYWVEHYVEFVEFFFSQVFTEPHSTKQREDSVGWALETDAQTLVATQLTARRDEGAVTALAKRTCCPVLVIHGTEDGVRPHDSGAALAELTDGVLVSLQGSGHCPHARDPVKVNLLLLDFISRVAPRLRPGLARGHAVSGRCTSPRQSGLATRSGTLRSRGSCGSWCRTFRSIGSPRTR